MKTYVTQTELGKTLFMDNGKIKLGLTTEQGMRISHISFLGGENLCFEDKQKQEKCLLPDNTIWYSLGGHRLWKSPEDFYCYFDDNAPCTLSGENAITLTAPVNRQGLALSMCVEFDQICTEKVTVTHRIVNRSSTTQKVAAWGISSLKCPAQAILYTDDATTGLQPNRNLILWPYTDVADDRIKVQKGKITVQGKAGRAPLKIGTYSPCGKIAYVYGDTMLTVSCDAQQADSQHYPDYGCNIECYTNKNVLEVETLSPVTCLLADQTLTHVEHWTFAQDEELSR